MNWSVSDQSRTALPLHLQSAKHLSAQGADMKVRQRGVFVLWDLWLFYINHHFGLFQDYYFSLWRYDQTLSMRSGVFLLLLLMESNFGSYLLLDSGCLMEKLKLKVSTAASDAAFTAEFGSWVGVGPIQTHKAWSDIGGDGSIHWLNFRTHLFNFSLKSLKLPNHHYPSHPHVKE